ncbi:MAG: hypothetical protein R3300_16180, partial [Candidatus Promineifilaceae bacterium]|nr:hypothetical protein [Candidatus Promineifilaceae bacterium]
EIDSGGAILKRLVTGFSIRHVVAVGRTAQRALTQLGVGHLPVRHPSHGGKKAFLAGLDRWLVTD